MTPKEKAMELVDRFAKESRFAKEAWNFYENTEWNYDKHCALICIDKMIETLLPYDGILYVPEEIEELEEVKKEINKL